MGSIPTASTIFLAALVSYRSRWASVVAPRPAAAVLGAIPTPLRCAPLRSSALAFTGRSDYNDSAVTLFSRLAALLPDPPARVLALGWRDGDEALEGDGLEVVRFAETGEIEAAGRFDAVVWRGDGSEEEAAGAVERLGRQLSDDGRVIVAAQQPAGAPPPSRRRGSLPARGETGMRRIVRALSEAGFAIRRDQVLGAEGREAGWRVTVAHRDRFVIRAYREGDEAAIVRLFAACFPHAERGLAHWRWKYAANPWGRRLISLAFSPAGELASHYSGYPIPFWRGDAPGGRTFLGLQMGDTMTGEAFRSAGRGKGALLARTVRHFFSIHRDGSYGFFYGFNTGAIQRFCRWFIGGSDTLPVDYRVRSVESPPEDPGGGYRIERVAQVDRGWDRFFRRVAPAYGFLVRRDAEYLRWRYLRCPDTRYIVLAVRRWGRLVGWGVFRRRGDAVAWGDALLDPRHARASGPLLAAALAEPELAGARRIEAWFPDRPAWWSRRLAELGFAAAPEPQGLGMVALADAEPQAFDALGQLYYTMGDGDLF